MRRARDEACLGEADRRLYHPRTHTCCYQREHTEAPETKQRHKPYRRRQTPELQLNKQSRTPPNTTPEEEHKADEEFDGTTHTSTLGGEDQAHEKSTGEN